MFLIISLDYVFFKKNKKHYSKKIIHMGFFKTIGRIGGKSYQGFKRGFNQVASPIYKFSRGALSIGNHVDTLLKLAEHIPLAGEVVADIRDSPQYHEIRATLDTGKDILDRGQHYISKADRLTQAGLTYLAQNEGGEVDQQITEVFNQTGDTLKTGVDILTGSSTLAGQTQQLGGNIMKLFG